MSKESNVATKAIETVFELREEAYDHPLPNFRCIAKMWEEILGVEVLPAQVGLCMIATKLARELHQHSEDNLIDICGYALTVERCLDAGVVKPGTMIFMDKKGRPIL